MAIVLVEWAGVLVLGILLLWGVMTDPPEALDTALALVALAVLVLVWLGVVLVGLWRRRPWSRAAGVVFQVMLFAIGVGALQGAFAQPEWGWPLILLGIAGFVSLVKRSTALWLSGADQAS